MESGLTNMDEHPLNQLRKLHLQLGEVAFRLARMRGSVVPMRPGWCPSVNLYECRDEFVICVDLAGVQRSAIELQVEPLRVLLRGVRPAPEPEQKGDRALRIVALEIDHGPFAREIRLPAEVQPERVRAEHIEGILWIHLPWLTPS